MCFLLLFLQEAGQVGVPVRAEEVRARQPQQARLELYGQPKTIIDYRIYVCGLRADGGMIWVAVKCSGGRDEIPAPHRPRAVLSNLLPR